MRADGEHRHRRHDAEEFDRREEDAEDLLRVRVRLAVRVVQLVELALEAALAVERLDDRHPGDGLGELRRHPRDPVSHLESPAGETHDPRKTEQAYERIGVIRGHSPSGSYANVKLE